MGKNEEGKPNGIGILYEQKPAKGEEWAMQISSEVF